VSGPSASSATVQWASLAAAHDRLFDIATGASATISDVTIEFGQAAAGESGGGVLVAAGAAATLQDDVIDQNQSSLTNGTEVGGGGVDVEGTATVADSTISDNAAGNGSNPPAALAPGGGIRLGATSGATLTVTGSTVARNAGNVGGGIENDGTGAVTIGNSTIVSNTSGVVGGGVAQE